MDYLGFDVVVKGDKVYGQMRADTASALGLTRRPQVGPFPHNEENDEVLFGIAGWWGFRPPQPF